MREKSVSLDLAAGDLAAGDLAAGDLAAGEVLARAVYGADGKKLLSRGHVLTPSDAGVLRQQGTTEVWVVERGEGEIDENEAALRAADGFAGGSVEIRAGAGGRVNLLATEASCILVDQDRLRKLNLPGGLVAATVPHFSYAAAGQRVASVKSVPFTVPRGRLDEFQSELSANGAVLEARAFRSPSIAVIYCDPESGDRARGRFESVLTKRLERFGVRAHPVHVAREEDALLAAIVSAASTSPSGILIASTTAPAGPEDAVGRAMRAAGCVVERFLAPVEPGNLFLLGYRDAVPVISAPGCFQSSKPNVLDLVLPPVLARHRVVASDIAGLGHGGLLG